MAYVTGEKGAHIQGLMDQSNEEFDKGNLEESVSLLEQAWGELPADKIIFDESFLIIWDILDISIILNDTVRMKKWVDNIFVADPARGDTGERELWAGKVAFELGDLSVAKEYLDTANQKSRGRCFGVEDAKYLKFLKNNK